MESTTLAESANRSGPQAKAVEEPKQPKKGDWKMVISTEGYEFAHGKRPGGYGLWAFKINENLEFFQGTYGNTVRMAKEYAREILRDNTAVIRVQP